MITKQGIFKNIKDLESKTVDVWNGKEWSEVIIRKTRNNEKVVRVTLSDGSYLDCTTDHKFSVKDRFLKEWNKVEAKDLMSFSKYALQFEPFIIDDVNEKGKTLPSAYTLGFAVGDGCVYDNIVYIDLYGDKDIKCPVTGVRHKKYKPKGYNVEKQKVRTFLDGNLVSKLKTDAVSILELSQYKKKDVIDFISGWADADGAQSSKGIRIYLSDEHRARCLQLLLTRFGIKSSVNLFQKKGIKTNLGIRKKDLWYIQITKTIDLNTHRLITENEQEPKYKSKYQNIKNVELLEGKTRCILFCRI